jgi:4-hydroxy-tetrahydrodipicolinate synthase
MSPFQGLSAFPITPADEHGVVDTAALRALIARLTAAGVDSIGLLGSTGTYPFFSRVERRRAIEAAVDATGGKTPILAGIGALRTDAAVQLAQDAKAAGAAAGLLAPVSYTPLTDDEVFEHFATVSKASDLPLCIYNNPGTTHFTFSADLIGRLSRLPHVHAVKNPAPGADAVAAHLDTLRSRVPDGFALGYSVDANAAEALIAGGQAWYSVAGGLFPAPCVAIVRAAQRGDFKEARRLNAGLQPLWDLFANYSGVRVMYAAAKLLDICQAEPPRPILPLPEMAQQRITRVLKDAGLR